VDHEGIEPSTSAPGASALGGVSPDVAHATPAIPSPTLVARLDPAACARLGDGSGSHETRRRSYRRACVGT
jgi:hypothetical protein